MVTDRNTNKTLEGIIRRLPPFTRFLRVAALSARLLQVANSPLYRRRTPVENLQTAITLMGNRILAEAIFTGRKVLLWNGDGVATGDTWLVMLHKPVR